MVGDMPDDVWFHILGCLRPWEVCTFGRASRDCRRLCDRAPMWDGVRVAMKLRPVRPSAWKLTSSYKIVVNAACLLCKSRRRTSRQPLCVQCIKGNRMLNVQWKDMVTSRAGIRAQEGQIALCQMIMAHDHWSRDRLRQQVVTAHTTMEVLRQRLHAQQQFWEHTLKWALLDPLQRSGLP